jgi:hypothetical protein
VIEATGSEHPGRMGVRQGYVNGDKHE